MAERLGTLTEIADAIRQTDVVQQRTKEINDFAVEKMNEIEGKAQEALETIPEDYQQLVDDVSRLSESIEDFSKDYNWQNKTGGWHSEPCHIVKGRTVEIAISGYVGVENNYISFAKEVGGDKKQGHKITGNETYTLTAEDNYSYIYLGVSGGVTSISVSVSADSVYDAIESKVSPVETRVEMIEEAIWPKPENTTYNTEIKGNTLSTTNRWFLNGSAIGNLLSVTLRFRNATSVLIELWEKREDNLIKVGEKTLTGDAPYTWKTVEFEHKSDYPMYISVVPSDGTTLYQTTDTAKEFNAYKTPDKASDALAFDSLLTFTGLCVIGYMTYKNVKTGKPPIITVAQNGNCDYTTIAEAVQNAKDGDTILVYSGVYTEPVEAWGKTLNIIGVDKKSCIIKNSTANYATPAVEIDSGRLANFTIISDGANPTCSASDVNNYMKDYSIHVDDAHGTGKTLIIEDCIIRNNHRTALGMGCYADNTVIVRNCDIWSDVPPSDIQNPLWNKRGALYFHNRQNSAYFNSVTGQKMRFIGNTIYCEDIIAVYIGDTWQSDFDSKGYVNEMEVEFINNMICAKKPDGSYKTTSDGIATPIAFTQDSIVGGTGFTNHIKLSDISYGNNVAYLNA